jgi:sterol desaturase/sphingolipid hydroxylase (fatty acid hydroxylase superfamily)
MYRSTMATPESAWVTMRAATSLNQTKIGYYAELFIYPVVVSGLLLFELAGNGLASHLRWWFAAGCGAVLWTLAEYLVHRFIYHKLPVLRELHGMHHAHPGDLIGAPVWVSVVIFSMFFLLVARLCDIQIACGATSGLIVGYIAYLLVHDAVHRWPLGENSWLRGHRRRHIRHHRHAPPGNFGVTTGFWDFAFGTAIAAGPARRAQ